MLVVEKDKIWQFDVDDTLVLWSPEINAEHAPYAAIQGPSGHRVCLVPNKPNVELLKKLATVGWYIRVHSGSGWAWAEAVVKALGLEDYVDEVTSKPLGNTDDKPPGDGLAYKVYLDPITSEEIA